MISHTLLLGTCFSCVLALGAFGPGKTESVQSTRMSVPVSTQSANNAVRKHDAIALRRDSAADFEMAKISAEGVLRAAQERCDAQGAAMSDSCKDTAKDAYEDSVSAAAERLVDSTREVALSQ
jgi:hypothetical protein